MNFAEIFVDSRYGRREEWQESLLFFSFFCYLVFLPFWPLANEFHELGSGESDIKAHSGEWRKIAVHISRRGQSRLSVAMSPHKHGIYELLYDWKRPYSLHTTYHPHALHFLHTLQMAADSSSLSPLPLPVSSSSINRSLMHPVMF